MGCMNGKDVDTAGSPRLKKNKFPPNRAQQFGAPAEESDEPEASIGFTDMQGHLGEQQARRRRIARTTTAQQERLGRAHEKHKQELLARETALGKSESPPDSPNESKASPLGASRSEGGLNSPAQPMVTSGPRASNDAEAPGGRAAQNALTIIEPKAREEGVGVVHLQDDTAMAMLRGQKVATSKHHGPVTSTPAAKAKATGDKVAVAQPKRQFFFMDE
jgi:hypothetical protein